MPNTENPSEFNLAKGFVAIRKTPRSANKKFNLSSIASLAEKREIIRDDALHSDRSLELQKGVGLEEIDSPQHFGESKKILTPTTQKGVYARLGYIGAYIVQPQDDKQAKEAENLLEDDYFIIPNVKMTLPNTVKTEMRGERNAANAFPEESGISLAHSKGIKGADAQVMVLDTGCDADHAQFKHTTINYRYVTPTAPRKRRKVRGFDPDGHGTHVCGIIAGKDVGVAPDVSLNVASVIDSESVETSLRRVLSALDWLMSVVGNQGINGNAVILNMSLGLKPDWIKGKLEIQTLAMRSVLQILVEDFDVLPIVASGNDGAGNLRVPGYFPEVLSVGAVDYDGQVSDFTSTGAIIIDECSRQVPDIMGYGVNVYSSLERNSENRSVYAEKSGTSMAAPYVTGIAALYAQHTKLTGKKLREEIMKNKSELGIAKFVL